MCLDTTRVKASVHVRPVCKKMNDVTPNAVFLSRTFEPSHEELHAFVRTETERSRPSQDRKPLLAPLTSQSG
ncbi:hypothetical protein BJV74DRAFT_819193 [Russula compacta]|nr:hypothetical protein BJV74DRAFT_819193 [Russula compacta]